MKASKNQYVAALLLAGALGLGTTGCSGSSADPADSAPPSPSLPPGTAPANTPLGTGQRAWAAFSERGLSQEDWWARLRPLLSTAARATYRYDDPDNLPEMSLTGKIHLAAKTPGAKKYTAEVIVPTSKGVFALDLERHHKGATWLLFGIKFPKGVH